LKQGKELAGGEWTSLRKKKGGKGDAARGQMVVENNPGPAKNLRIDGDCVTTQKRRSSER